MKTIHLLPTDDEIAFHLNLGTENMSYALIGDERRRIAATLDYIPDSLETLEAIEYFDKKWLMTYNTKFYHAAIALCTDIISDMIEIAKEIADQYIIEGEADWEGIRERLESAATADDLIRSGYYGFDFETARHEFANCLVEDYLHE